MDLKCKPDWLDGAKMSVTVTDKNGIVVYANVNNEIENYEELMGRDIFECHPEPSRSLLRDMYSNPRDNTYTIEKNGRKKLIHQTPWYKAGEFAGYIEFSFVIPIDMPHHKRD